jgi:HEPN domain-containing protein
MEDAARWEQGRASIDSLVAEGRLQLVQPNRELAQLLVAQALVHLESARTVAVVDPVGSFQLTYHAARKALAAILVNQGLRPTGGGGGHAVLLIAVRAQLHPPLGVDLAPFDWMRRTRNDSEYPTADAPVASREDLDEALPAAERIIEIATRVLPTMPAF